MIYLGDLQKVTDTKSKVGFVHFMPLDAESGLHKTIDELNTTGVLVEVLPQAEKIDGKNAVLCVNPQTKEIFYEYVDIPLTPEEEMRRKIEEQQKKIDLQQQAIDDLVMNVLPSIMPQ